MCCDESEGRTNLPEHILAKNNASQCNWTSLSSNALCESVEIKMPLYFTLLFVLG